MLLVVIERSSSVDVGAIVADEESVERGSDDLLSPSTSFMSSPSPLFFPLLIFEDCENGVDADDAVMRSFDSRMNWNGEMMVIQEDWSSSM
jgi:hypothetical protein